MRVFTVQMAKRRLATKYNIDLLDITVKTGRDRNSGAPSLFAPTWDMVLNHKKFTAGEGGYDDEAYKRDYRRILIDTWMNRRDEWMAVLQNDSPVALACYCPAGAFCHRHLLKDFFERLCKQLEIPFEYYGELTYESPVSETSNEIPAERSDEHRPTVPDHPVASGRL